MNATDIKFRCSSLGYLMINPRNKSEKISETTKTHLVDLFVSHYYGRHEEVTSKYIEKGNEREEDAITLLSVQTKRFYKKNEQQIENEFISGTPDLFVGDSIENAKEVDDIKNSWSAFTFFRTVFNGIPDLYYWQIHGYMALTGAEVGTINQCLVNGTVSAIMEEKRKASFRYGPDPDASHEYREECKQIEINHIFDLAAFKKENPSFDFHNNLSEWKWDIPAKERLVRFSFKRDEEVIQRIYQRVRDSREWMNKHLFKLAA